MRLQDMISIYQNENQLCIYNLAMMNPKMKGNNFIYNTIKRNKILNAFNKRKYKYKTCILKTIEHC